MTERTPDLSIGDLVRVQEGTHDDRLPKGRTGLIVERTAKGVYKVWMTNGEVLRFHSMFLDVVTEAPKRKEDEKKD